MNHVLLGILADGPATGYQLKQVIDADLVGLWRADQSQIYRSLTALVRDGLASRSTVIQTDRPSQHPHTITEAGRAELSSWLSESPEPVPTARDPLLLRVWFLGREDPDLARRTLAVRRKDLVALEAQLTTQAHQEWPRGSDPNDALRYAARAHRLAHIRTDLAWIDATDRLLASLDAPKSAADSEFEHRDKG